MNDEVILKLLEEISGDDIFPGDATDGFRFFKVEPVMFEGDPYRLVLTAPNSESYLGVVNAFRIRRKK